MSNNCIPNISVVIPTYNRAEELALTLPSYINNMYVREIIVVNNGSTDTTSDVVSSYINDVARVVEIKLPDKIGAPKARTIGLSYVDCEYILLGEDDVYLAPDYTKVLYDQLSENSCDIISGKIINIRVSSTGDLGKLISDLDTREMEGFPQDFSPYQVSLSQLKTGRPIQVPYSHIIILGKKSVFDNIDFDPWYSAGNGYREDTDFLLTARKHGFKLFFSQDTVCFHLRGILSQKGGQRINRILIEYWAIYNTWYMTKKHWGLVSDDFKLINGPLYNTVIYSLSRWKYYFQRILQ
ncbi:MAG: glycosyltransferase [Geobacter sp.]|nr:glycosyltransferase [Geobacter sp.]